MGPFVFSVDMMNDMLVVELLVVEHMFLLKREAFARFSPLGTLVHVSPS